MLQRLCMVREDGGETVIDELKQWAEAEEKAYNRGYKEGYEAGLKEGRKQGYNAGYDVGLYRREELDNYVNDCINRACEAIKVSAEDMANALRRSFCTEVKDGTID